MSVGVLEGKSVEVQTDFPKRRYLRLAELVRDIRIMAGQRQQIRAVMRGGIDPAFRERLMLAVTGVNDCRYCSYAHARMALTAGLSPDDVAGLSKGEFAGAPAEQVPALLYAQHWADTHASPDPEVRRELIRSHGVGKVRDIELLLHLIRTANLMGNSFDYLLHRISFGRWGNSS